MANFIGNDANGTDGSDLSKMFAVYEHRGRLVRIPADTPAANIPDALAQELGSTAAKENAMRDAMLAIADPFVDATNLTQVNARLETLRRAIKALAMYTRSQNET
jgi:hypothetical protein